MSEEGFQRHFFLVRKFVLVMLNANTANCTRILINLFNRLLSFFYLCQAEDVVDEVSLTANEMRNGLHFAFVNPFEILQENSDRLAAGELPCLFERDRQLLSKLISDSLFE